MHVYIYIYTYACHGCGYYACIYIKYICIICVYMWASSNSTCKVSAPVTDLHALPYGSTYPGHLGLQDGAPGFHVLFWDLTSS